MTTISLNRAGRSRLFLATLEALDAPLEPVTPEDHAKHAFAETMAFTDDWDRPIILALAEAIDAHVYEVIHHSDCQYAEVMADDLRGIHGTPTVNLALKLAGIRPRRGPGAKAIWTDAPMDGRTRTVPVKLPATLLDDLNAP
tara:strand:- start:3828 stop:4253 length:426 start_codon:yes stop_codon:yes gene_type:complete